MQATGQPQDIRLRRDYYIPGLDGERMSKSPSRVRPTFNVGDPVAILTQTDWHPSLQKAKTGTVVKVFKNGKIAVAVHQMPTRNGVLGGKVIHLDTCDVAQRGIR